MEIGKNRPLCCFCWIVTLLCMAEAFLSPGKTVFLCLLIAAALFAVASLICALRIRSFRMKGFYLCFLSLAVLLSSGVILFQKVEVDEPVAAFSTREGEEREVTGVVLSRDFDSSYQTTLTASVRIDGDRTVKTELICNYGSNLQPGDRFRLMGSVCPIFDAEEDEARVRTLRSEGYRMVVTATDEDSETVTERDVFDWRITFASWQRRLSLRIRDGVGGEQGKLVSALLLGTKDGLSAGTKLDFRRAGASHLLALSGLHLSLLLGVFAFLLKKIRCPFRLRLVLISAVAVFYLFLTGGSVSTLRATVMFLCLNFSALFGRSHDPLTALSAFTAACLLYNPAATFSTALWLSVLAAFVLVEVVPGLSRQKSASGAKSALVRMLIKVLKPLGASCVVLLFLLLPMAIFFGEFSLISPLATLILTPLTAVILILGLFFLMLGLFPWTWITPLTRAVASLLRRCAAAMISLCEEWSDLRGVVVSLRYPFLKWLFPILIVGILAFLFLKWKKPRRFLAFLGAWIVCFGVGIALFSASAARATETVYQTHGKNELLCFSTEGKCLLCDVTDGSYTAYADFFEDGLPVGTTEVEALVLTHYHERHIATVGKILSRVRVREIWLPLTMPDASAEKAAQDESILYAIVNSAGERRVRVRYYLPENGADAGFVRMDRLFYSMLKRSTHPTLAMTWSYPPASDGEGETLVYLGASATESTSAGIIAENAALSDVLIFGKHGPVVKQEVSLPVWSDTLGTVLFGDGNVAVTLADGKDAATALARAEIVACGPEGRVTLRSQRKKEDAVKE